MKTLLPSDIFFAFSIKPRFALTRWWHSAWNKFFLQLLNFYTRYIFIPPENLRKPKVFWCFQGGVEMWHWTKMGRRLRRHTQHILVQVQTRISGRHASIEKWGQYIWGSIFDAYPLYFYCCIRVTLRYRTVHTCIFLMVSYIILIASNRWLYVMLCYVFFV